MSRGQIRPMRRNTFTELIEDQPCAVHGEHAPAIKSETIVECWRTHWRVVLASITPLQRRALELELGIDAKRGEEALDMA